MAYGAAFVDLSPVTDAPLVPDAIASALGLVGRGRERPLDTLERASLALGLDLEIRLVPAGRPKGRRQSSRRAA